jgi:hypothetical protein
MTWFRSHLVSVAVIAAAVAVVAGVFVFALPSPHPYVMPPPPDAGLPYTTVSYSAADAQRAFAAVGIKLLLHTRERHALITDLSTKDLIVEADAFADPKKVAASGFSNYYTVVDGHWVHAPRTCAHGARNAERWRGNLRVIVSCSRAGSTSSRWLRRVDLALARL